MHAAAVLACSVVLAVVWTWPLAARLSSRIPHDPGDPILNTWILWWNAQGLPLTERWWDAPIMTPLGDTLALSEHLLGLSALAWPMQFAGAGPLAAYNVSLLLTYALSAFFAYLLVYRLTGSIAASACAGLAYAVAPYRAGQLAHIQVLTSQWMPALLLGMHGYVESGRRRWLVVVGAAWLVQALSNGYYLLFLPALLVPWMAWFAPWRRRPARGAALAATLAVASLPLAPILWKYHQVHQALGLGRSLGDLRQFSATWESFTHAPRLLVFWPAGDGRSQEDYLFPGVTVMVATMLAVAAMGAGRLWRSTPAARDRRADADAALVFYAAAAVWMFALAFGPGGEPDGPASMLRPYTWLLWLPGFEGLRVPARFAMLGAACLSIAAGLAVARVPARGRLRTFATAVALTGIAGDGAMERLPMASPPPRINLEGAADAAVLEMPPDDPQVSAAAMYRSIWHRQPLVNGYSGHTPPHYAVLSLALWRGDTTVLTYLAAERPVAIVVNEAADRGGDFARMMAAMPGVAHRGVSSVGPIWLLPQTPRAAPPALTPVAATASDAGARRLVFDTGAAQTLAGLSFRMRGRYRDVPERLSIEVSDDGQAWREAWLGWTGAYALDAALRDPRLAPVQIAFAPVRARYVRVYPAPEWLAADGEVLTSAR